MVFSKANALQLKPVLLYGGKNGNFIQACRLKRAKVRDQKIFDSNNFEYSKF